MDPATLAAYYGSASGSFGPERRSRRGRKVWASTTPRMPSAPYMFRGQKPQCQAVVLRATSDVLSGIPGEQEVRCNARASEGDSLCPAHRRQVNMAAASGGRRTTGNAIIKVPQKAFVHRDCRFPAYALKLISEGIVQPLTELEPEAMVAIWDPVIHDKAFYRSLGSMLGK